MFGGSKKRTLDQMTNGGIISTIVFFVFIGGIIIAVSIMKAVEIGSVFSIVWNAIGVVFVTAVLIGVIAPAIRELRRRRRPDAKSRRETAA